jgi:hypothetical protein
LGGPSLYWIRIVAGLMLVFAWSRGADCESRELPVYICDNHGEFYFHLRDIDPAFAYHLVNIDAHPDSIPLQDGIIQCFNWIHGLTPRPISGLTWVPGISDLDRTPYDVRHFLEVTRAWFPDGESGIVPLEKLTADRFREKRVVVSVDLDFFRKPEAYLQDMHAVFSFAFQIENLDRIAIAISRPYLSDDAAAFRLLSLAFAEIFGSPRVGRIRFEPFLTLTPDTSNKARALRAQGLEVPYFDITKAPEDFRNLLREHRQRIVVNENHEKWEEFLVSGPGSTNIEDKFSRPPY